MFSEYCLRVIRFQFIESRLLHANGGDVDEFRRKVRELASRFEVVSVPAALDFLSGRYRPRRNLCLLTFDGGLRGHYTIVYPALREMRINGVFLLITGCIETGRVSPFHINDLLIEAMGFDAYAQRFFRRAVAIRPDAFAPLRIDPARAAKDYPLDSPELARFKDLFDYGLDSDFRDRLVRELFCEEIGKESEVAEELYIRWNEAQHMQSDGMMIGGHSHQHRSLATMAAAELNWDLGTCYQLLRRNLKQQAVWPFSYPNGRQYSFNVRSLRALERFGFGCAFSGETADNFRGCNPYAIKRVSLDERVRPVQTSPNALARAAGESVDL